MLMVFKYQVVNCQYPEDILCVTLNHLDAIRMCAMPYPDLKKRTESVFSLLISVSLSSLISQSNVFCLFLICQ